MQLLRTHPEVDDGELFAKKKLYRARCPREYMARGQKVKLLQ